jgi:hypothetical protein
MARALSRLIVGIHKNHPVGKTALFSTCTQLNIHAPDFPLDLKVSKQLDGTPELRYPPDTITLMTANFSEEELTLPKGTILGVVQDISKNLEVRVSDRKTLITV